MKRALPEESDDSTPATSSSLPLGMPAHASTSGHAPHELGTSEPELHESGTSDPELHESGTSDPERAQPAGASAPPTPALATRGRRRPKPWVVALVAALLGATGLGLFALHQRTESASRASESSTPSASPGLPSLPASLPGGYTLQHTTPAPTPSLNADGSRAITGTYLQDGRASVVVMISQPTADAVTFLRAAGFRAITAQGADAACGTGSPAKGQPTIDPYAACVVVRQQTAVVSVGALNQPATQLLAVDRQFADQILAH